MNGLNFIERMTNRPDYIWLVFAPASNEPPFPFLIGGTPEQIEKNKRELGPDTCARLRYEGNSYDQAMEVMNQIW